MASSIQKVATTAYNAGVSIEELFAVYSSLTGVTGKAVDVTTQLRSAINAISAPTEASAKLMDELGIEYGKSAIEANGFVDVLKDVYDAVDGNREELRKIIPDINALQLVEALATTQNEKYGESLENLADSH